MRNAAHIFLRLCLPALLVTFSCRLAAQPVIKKYDIKNGHQYIALSKNIKASALDSFMNQFNLKDLPLKEFMKTNSSDSLKKLGWNIDISNKGVVVISKAIESYEKILNAADKIFMGFNKAESDAGLYQQVYGLNKFKNKAPFAENGSLVTFYLRNNRQASKVLLAGSFTHWQTHALAMTKTDSGWIANVKLDEGKHWYKFIINDEWSIDQDNMINEGDGMGNINSVYFKTNVVFSLPSFTNAKKVYLAGSFNQWREKEILLNKTSRGWELPLYLSQGTHTYKFLVDGQWHVDERNKNKLPDGHGAYNAVMRIGKEYMFRLQGYKSARHVFVAGTFNEWKSEELEMNKTEDGWELPYYLGAGNYEYKFIVAGKWITDPANAYTAGKGGDMANSILVIEPNYTFVLKGYDNAKEVFLSGDFNNWSPNSMPMKHEGNGWKFNVHLTPGKHIYKFVVDNKWILDPANKMWEQNEYSTDNSVLWIANKAFAN